MRNRWVEAAVGLFMVLGLLGLVVLAFRVSGFAMVNDHHYYTLYAEFDNTGTLKVRAPVKMSGVTVGRVTSIGLDPKTYRARVEIRVENNVNSLPIDTSASIFTEGLLGSNYVSLIPGFEDENLKAGDQIETTHSALILENLIGQLVYSLKEGGSENGASDSGHRDLHQDLKQGPKEDAKKEGK